MQVRFELVPVILGDVSICEAFEYTEVADVRRCTGESFIESLPVESVLWSMVVDVDGSENGLLSEGIEEFSSVKHGLGGLISYTVYAFCFTILLRHLDYGAPMNDATVAQVFLKFTRHIPPPPPSVQL